MIAQDGDARELWVDSQEELRRRVVAAVDDGISQRQAAHLFEVSPRSVGLWIRLHRAAGQDAPQAPRPDRRPATQLALPRRAQIELLQEMAAGPPHRSSLEGELWSRRTFSALILARTGCRVSPTTANRYLFRWGLAGPTGTEAVPTSLGEALPQERADAGGAPRTWTLAWTRPAPLFDGSESVADHRSLAAGPQQERPGQAASCLEALIVRSGRGELLFELSPVPYRPRDLSDFGQRLVRCVGSAHLAIRSWPAEHTHTLRAWAAETGPDLSLSVWRHPAAALPSTFHPPADPRKGENR